LAKTELWLKEVGGIRFGFVFHQIESISFSVYDSLTKNCY